jgi:hypothetical protein
MVGDMDEMTGFIGRVGCLYGKKGLCSPFRLREFAEAWRLEGIPLQYCADQIKSHLDEYSGRYRCGSGDGGMVWLDRVMRDSWYRLIRPPRALPERTDRLYNTDDAIGGPDAQRIIDLVNQIPRPAQPIGLAPIAKVGLGREPRDVPSHPSRMGPSPRPAADRAATTPNPVQAVILKPIDTAEAFLRRELANGEVAASVIEVREGRRHLSEDAGQGALPPAGCHSTHRLWQDRQIVAVLAYNAMRYPGRHKSWRARAL